MDPIRIVIENNYAKSLKEAIEKGLDPNTRIDDQTLLFWAVESKSTECAKILLESKANTSATAHNEILSLACRNAYECIDMPKLLLEHKANVFAPDGGWYPLHNSVLSRSFECVKLLINAGASRIIDIKTLSGSTALYFAVNATNSISDSIVSLLLDYGAKIDNMKNPNRHCELFIKRKNIKRTLIVFYHLGRKTKCLGKDITNMIGKMVWETRDQDEWLNQNPSKKYKK
jgi:ankyrin repeat protein